MTDQSRLEAEISSARQLIASDGYPMSIGELTNLYRDGELVIRPEFQRFFRWTALQKSRLVESLMLGIPLPSIFVAQTDSGVWEVVDGLQRLSTIFELQGELRDPAGSIKPALILQGTKYLPSMQDRSWSNTNPAKSLTDAQKLDVKRSKLDIKIIKRESSAQTKFDLFQRLNSYGSQLNAQEMRSALLVAVSPGFFAKIESLASYPSFTSCVQLSDKQIEERFDLELVTRFVVLHNLSPDKANASNLRDLSQVLDDATVKLATIFPDGFDHVEQTFKATFDFIRNNGDEQVFRRWDKLRLEFRGPFLTSAFEIFALGIGYNIANNIPVKTNLIEISKRLWSSEQMQSGYSTGRSTESRLADFIPLGRDLTSDLGESL